mgnify:CR=1 FL=1
MNIMKTCIFILGIIVSTACSAGEISNDYIHESYSDVENFTLDTGDKIPSIALPDSQGEKHNLRLLSAKQNLLLVIYRGEWCPFCIGQLESFEAVLPELKAYQTRLVAVSPDDMATNKNTQRQFTQGYLFLSDSEMRLIDELGLRKNESLPHPATILIEKGGNVLWYYVDPDYKTRPSGEQMRKVLKQYLQK